MATPFPFVSGNTLTAAQLNAITELVVNDKTASHTLTAADAGDRVIMNSASATTITVNTSVFTAGQVIYVTNKGAGVCTITAGTATVSTTGSLALAQFASGVLYCISGGVFIFEAYGVTSVSGVVQVKSTTKTDTFTMASATFADITGLSVSITPTSASNKILVVYACNVGSDPATSPGATRLMRDSTAIGIADAAGSRYITTNSSLTTSTTQMATHAMTFLDSPATTSAITYKVQAGAAGATTIGINRTVTDTDSIANARGVSSITVFEVTP